MCNLECDKITVSKRQTGQGGLFDVSVPGLNLVDVVFVPPQRQRRDPGLESREVVKRADGLPLLPPLTGLGPPLTGVGILPPPIGSGDGLGSTMRPRHPGLDSGEIVKRAADPQIDGGALLGLEGLDGRLPRLGDDVDDLLGEVGQGGGLGRNKRPRQQPRDPGLESREVVKRTAGPQSLVDTFDNIGLLESGVFEGLTAAIQVA